MGHERRQFSRITFHSDADLLLPDGAHPVKIEDLSLKGALVVPHTPMFVRVGSPVTLRLRLDALGTSIRMDMVVVHHQKGVYGLYCQSIDLDSVTHLRRLVELNLGDAQLLERELPLLRRD